MAVGLNSSGKKNLEVYSHTNWSVRLQSRIKEQTASVESVINGG